MTAFESFFKALKKVLGKPDLYDTWPDFEPVYDESEYAWTTMRGLGEVLLLNCGPCDGPSDPRHPRCEECIERRGRIAAEAYKEATGKVKEKWETVILCRIHTR